MLPGSVAALSGFMDNHERKIMETLHIIEHENRGSKDVPFGFVYFSDDTRVLYALLPENPEGVQSSGGQNWPPVTRVHVRLAQTYLIENGVLPSSTPRV